MGLDLPVRLLMFLFSERNENKSSDIKKLRLNEEGFKRALSEDYRCSIYCGNECFYYFMY